MSMIEVLQEHFDSLFEDFGLTVSYRRGHTSVSIEAVKLREQTVRYGDDYYATGDTDDFAFRVADLVTAGFNEPQRLDRITWTDGAGRERINIVSLDGVEKPYREMGGFGVLYRVHTASEK